MAAAMPLTIKPTTGGTSKKTTIRTLETGFGDGYSQRAGDGINTTDNELNLEWVGSDTNIDALIAHFVERAGYQAFTIADATIAGSVAYKWICKEWAPHDITDDTKSLTATLKRVYDL